MPTAPLVFLVDLDNTLLDNDRFRDDLRAEIARIGGAEAGERYWTIQEDLFRTLGYRDYLGACQDYRNERPDDPRAIWFATAILDYPYAARVYAGAREVLSRMRAIAPTVILSDGDAVFQPRKLIRSGLVEASSDGVMIPVHKEQELATIAERYPAERYVLVDDKLRILTAFKKAWGERVITVFPLQGQFALDAAVRAQNPAPDVTVAAIADLLDHPLLHG